MTENPEEGRKSARAKRAKKRDEDVLEDEADGDEEAKEVKKAPRASAKRRGGDATEAKPEAKAAGEPEADDAASAPEEVKDTKKAVEAAEEATADKEPAPEPEKELDPVEAGKVWLATIFDKMNLDLDVKGEEDDGNFVFNISGGDADSIAGRSHQSPRILKSIQTLLSEHLGKAARGNVVVDLGGFKQKRRSRLIGIADQLREAVGRTGEPIKIAGFNSYERRVVHQHLADFRDVDTESVDKGIFRKLSVMPD